MNRSLRLLAIAPFVATITVAATSSLQKSIQSIVATAPATIGLSATDLETGRHFELRGDERFPMGSVFKFPVALAVLQRVDRGEMHLNDAITITPAEFSTGFSPIRDAAKGKAVHSTLRDLVVAMLRDSDNTAADFLLARIGGAGKVNEMLRTLGVTGIRVDRSERQMGVDLHKPGGVAKYAVDDRDTSTPNGMATLLTKFHRAEDGLTPASHALALELMTASTTGPKRIRSVLPAGATLAHKTGTMPGTANDVGIIVSPDGRHHIVIAIFTKAGDSDRFDDRERAIALLAKEIYNEFTAVR